MKSNYIRRIAVGFLIFMLSFTSMLDNVSAEFKTYTLDDDGSSITITEGQQFNVTVPFGSYRLWALADYDYDTEYYDSSVLKVVDGGFWAFSSDWDWAYLHNVTFEGIKGGNYTILYERYNSYNLIDGNFTLNVTVIGSEPNILPIIIVVAIVGVVPAIIMLKWMKRGEKHEK
jgi:hypothetical protein